MGDDGNSSALSSYIGRRGNIAAEADEKARTLDQGFCLSQRSTKSKGPSEGCQIRPAREWNLGDKVKGKSSRRNERVLHALHGT
jgi:hypothetical protein